jgi:hypothetical protein
VLSDITFAKDFYSKANVLPFLKLYPFWIIIEYPRFQVDTSKSFGDGQQQKLNRPKNCRPG